MAAKSHSLSVPHAHVSFPKEADCSLQSECKETKVLLAKGQWHHSLASSLITYPTNVYQGPHVTHLLTEALCRVLHLYILFSPHNDPMNVITLQMKTAEPQYQSNRCRFQNQAVLGVDTELA